jgi:drug/metabolite transporter (DMT)-like permease
MAGLKRLFLLSFIWGWSFLFIKVAVEGMTPTTVAGARVALGASVLHPGRAPALAPLHRRRPRRLRHPVHAAGLG